MKPVYVVGSNGLGLMPTTPRKARKLVASGRAEVLFKVPYTIKLLYKTGCNTQPTFEGTDTGSQHIGIAVTTDEKVLSKEEYALRSTMDKRALIETRASYRMGRRHRKTRYRHPKFKPRTKRVYVKEKVRQNKHMTHWKKCKNEFASNKKEGWLPPSIQSKCDMTIQIIDRYKMILPPKTKFRHEVGRFDIARIKDPTVHGEMYQHGRLYDEENVRAYVFTRDDYACAVCKREAGSKRKDGSTVKLIAHHIDFRSKGATDNPDRMITVCDRCHTTVNHQKGGILYQWMLDGKKVARGYRDETFMNIIRKRLFKEFPDDEFTYGNFTAADRKALGLGKTHANDAVAIACQGRPIKDKHETIHYQQVRHNKRSLHEATARKGRKEPNCQQIRNAKNTKSVTLKRGAQKTFYVYDKVSYQGQVGWISGFSGTKAYVKDKDDNYIKYPDKSYNQVNLSDLSVISHNNNWLIGAMSPIGK